MTIKSLTTGALGFALVASPLLAFAHDDAKPAPNAPIIDKTAVSVAINDDGSVLVRGAKVTDISGDLITAHTVVRDVDVTWKISTDDATAFVKYDGSDTALSAVSDGDYVSFSGRLTGSDLFMADADTVRDWSLDGSVSTRWPWYDVPHWPVFGFFSHTKADSDNH